jgi:phosphohistidine phosphatase SixA
VGQPNRRRRIVLLGVGALLPGALAAQTVSLAGSARSGGVLLIRHAQTEAGIGDPPGFRLDQCSTQRNLSEAGRTQARAIGQWARRHGLQPTAVLSSQWCRCQETARLAFDRVEAWPPLNSTFAGQGDPDAQARALRERLQALAPGSLEIWVTHQVIMTALTGAYPDQGEGFMLDARGKLLARGMMQGQGDHR